MARYRLRVTQYCALANENKFQAWLHSTCPDLHADLLRQLDTGSSCKSNRHKMVEIQTRLQSRGLMSALVNYLLKEYPFVIETLREPGELRPRKISNTKKQVSKDDGKPVFAYYNAKLLTFPHKVVLQNSNVEALRRDVLNFCKGNIDTDYVIIGGKAYIEYFKPQYRNEAKQIKEESREIFIYRRKHGISQSQKIINKGQK